MDQPQPIDDRPDDNSRPDPAPNSDGQISGVQEDGLPVRLPLSPELLEDEAIRGDFVLRWVVVAVAFLFGCTEIDDARTLAHAQFGEWMQSHGWLPSAIDPFALTTDERRWVNLSWLFDHVTAAFFGFTGAAGLSFLQGVLAAVVVAGVSYAGRPHIRSWWGSVCCGLLILAAYPQTNWRPELVTLLGLAGLLWALLGLDTGRLPARGAWAIPPGLWLWSQLDARAWIGLLTLALWCCGRSVRSTELADPQRTSSAADVRWATIGVVSGLVLWIHPYGWETWLAPFRLYLYEYPALREAYSKPLLSELAWSPLWASAVWSRIDHRLAAGILLMLAALTTLLLNRRHAARVYWLWFAFVNSLAVWCVHELPVAAVVNAVIATVQGQDWYYRRFGQVYSVAWTEVFFSRGGRAITLCSLLAMGWVVVSGRLGPWDHHRTGIGLSRNLRHELDDLLKIADVVPDDRAFHFTLRQGDLLIAAGRRSFVDHRWGLFAGRGEQNLFKLHDRLRRALRQQTNSAESLTSDAAGLPVEFDTFDISHVLPRLSRSVVSPDYVTFMELLASPSWILADLLPTTGVFLRCDSPDAADNAWAQSHVLNVVQTGILSPDWTHTTPRTRPLPPVWSQQLLSKPSDCPAAGTMLAEHWLKLERELPTAPLPFQMAASLAAVRAALEGIHESPQQSAAYRVLGAAYLQLLRLEGLVLAESEVAWGRSLRFYQAVSALRQAQALNPRDPETELLLAELWQGAGKADVTADALDRFLKLTGAAVRDWTEAELSRRASLSQLRDRLWDVDASDRDRDAATAAQSDVLERALACYRGGCLNRSIAILQQDAVYVSRNPVARWQLAAWLAERGDGLDLDEAAAELSAQGTSLAGTNWRDAVAYAALGRSDYEEAIRVWSEARDAMATERLALAHLVTPWGTLFPVKPGDLHLAAAQLVALQAFGQPQRESLALLEWELGMCELERGQPDACQKALRQALDGTPNSPLRPLLRLYWLCLTNEALAP